MGKKTNRSNTVSHLLLPNTQIQMQQYQIASSIAEDEIRQRGFEVISRDDRFIDRPAIERPGDRPDDHVWWLIVARKP